MLYRLEQALPRLPGRPELVKVPGGGADSVAADVGLAARARADEIPADDGYVSVSRQRRRASLRRGAHAVDGTYDLGR
jgi:hypothetical protein